MAVAEDVSLMGWVNMPLVCFSPHGSLCSPALSASPSWGTGDVVYSSLKVGIYDCNGNHVDFSDQKSWLFTVLVYL